MTAPLRCSVRGQGATGLPSVPVGLLPLALVHAVVLYGKRAPSARQPAAPLPPALRPAHFLRRRCRPRRLVTIRPSAPGRGPISVDRTNEVDPVSRSADRAASRVHDQVVAAGFTLGFPLGGHEGGEVSEAHASTRQPR